MKSPVVTVVVLLLAPLLVHCAQTSKASSEETAAALNFEAPADRGVVFLYRTGRMVGAANAIEVRVNGQPAGGTAPGTFFRWELKPGTYTFFSAAKESSATVQVKVEAGKLYFIEQNARIGLQEGRVTLSKVSEKRGKDGLKGKKLVISAYVPD